MATALRIEPAPPAVQLESYMTGLARTRRPNMFRDIEGVDFDRGAVREMLLADLEGWPTVFRRALSETIVDLTKDDPSAFYLAERFMEGRNPEERPERHACGCGCYGRNDGVARGISELREAIDKYRACDTPRKRANRRPWVADVKERVLMALWIRGWRRIDRRTLAEHAAHEKRHQIEEQERHLERALDQAHHYRERLADGYFLSPKRRGERLPRETRAKFRRCMKRAEASIPQHQACIAELRRELEDVPALVRAYTGCQRLATGGAR